jgi:hypothetical protein
MRDDDNEHTTRWKNPTDKAVTLSFHRDRGVKRHKVTIEPGEEVILSGEYDSAIHQVHNDVVVGGMAPQLVKVGKEALPVTSTLGLAEAREAAAQRGNEMEEMRREMESLERDHDERRDRLLTRIENAEAIAKKNADDLAAAKARAADLEAELTKLRASIQGAPDAPAPAADAKPKK